MYVIYRTLLACVETADILLMVSEWRKCIARRSLDGAHDGREAARGSGSWSFTHKSGGHHAASAGRQALADTGRQLPKRQSENANRILLAILHFNPSIIIPRISRCEINPRIARRRHGVACGKVAWPQLSIRVLLIIRILYYECYNVALYIFKVILLFYYYFGDYYYY